MSKQVNIAIIQQPAVYLDLAKSVALAIQLIEQTAEQGANLIVFGESWLTGYPVWLDFATNYSKWDAPLTRELFGQIHRSSTTVDSEEMMAIAESTRANEVCVCLGFNELDHRKGGTIYNSVVIIDHGEVIFHHRKLMPTFTEKLLYGVGDGRGLQAVDSSVGRIGALICWEHWMPLTRQAMHDSGEEIHIALWPNVHDMLQVASRHYAFEGRTFVIAAGQVQTRAAMPKSLQFDESVPEILLNGGSALIDPKGNYLLPPQDETIPIAWCSIPDVTLRYGEKMALDVSGHYQRPDIFEFRVRKEPS